MGTIGDATLHVFMLLMLLSGTGNVLLKEYMVLVQAPTGPNGVSDSFNQIFLWGVLMKVGMFLCLPFECTPLKAPIRVYILSCTLGFIAQVLANTAYFVMAGSAIQMLRGGKVVFTCMLSIAFLKRDMQKYHYVGVLCVVLGMTLVGVSTFIQPVARSDQFSSSREAVEPSTLRTWGAIACCIACELCQAVLWVYQECVMKDYNIPPLQLVGAEGAIGIVMGAAILAVVNPLGLENTPEAYYQLTHSTPLLLCVVSYLLCIAFFNYSSVTVTQKSSAVTRSVLDVSRSSLIWLVELGLSWHEFSFAQFVGFVILVVGALIYNHILVLEPFEPSAEALPLKIEALPSSSPSPTKS